MEQCNNEKTAVEIYELFAEKLSKFDFVGNRTWGDPYGCFKSDTYGVKGNAGYLYCTLVDFGNRIGIATTLPEPKESISLGHITAITVPFEFSRSFSSRAYEQNGVVEIRNYGRFTIGRSGLKKDDFFNFVRELGLTTKIQYDEECKEYIKVFKIVNREIDDADFANSLIDFTLLVKAFKDKCRQMAQSIH